MTELCYIEGRNDDIRFISRFPPQMGARLLCSTLYSMRVPFRFSGQLGMIVLVHSSKDHYLSVYLLSSWSVAAQLVAHTIMSRGIPCIETQSWHFSLWL